MKKYNRLYGMLMPDGSATFIVAKNINHMKKILYKTDIIFDYDCFEDWGKFTQLSKSWNVKLNSLIERSGIAYLDSYGKRYWIL